MTKWIAAIVFFMALSPAHALDCNGAKYVVRSGEATCVSLTQEEIARRQKDHETWLAERNEKPKPTLKEEIDALRDEIETLKNGRQP